MNGANAVDSLAYHDGSGTPFDETDKTLSIPGLDAQPEHLVSPFAKDQQPECTISGVVDIPWKYRIPAFYMILVWGTGASFADVTIGPLKSTLIKQLGINSESRSSGWHRYCSYSPR